MALAGQWLAARYNRHGFPLFDFDVYALAGDGCMMEGISSEAASFAGHQQLSNLCWIYDSNRVTIEGHTDITFTEDVAARFTAYGWNVTTSATPTISSRSSGRSTVVRGRARAADADPRAQPHRLRHPGRGHAQGARRTAGRRGRQGGQALLRLARGRGIPRPGRGVRALRGRHRRARREAARRPGSQLFDDYRAAHPELADELERMQRRELPDGWDADCRRSPPTPRASPAATLGAGAERRRASTSLGSSAARPTSRPRRRRGLTFDGAGDFEPDDAAGRNLHFGVREHASAAIANGMALTKLRPFWSGFLIFSRLRPGRDSAVRTHGDPVVHIFTHDSIGVGEDGPTHQPVEQLASLRAIPGLLVFRPGDANEVVETWRFVVQLQHSPRSLVLSRQALPTLDRIRVRARGGAGERRVRAGRRGRRAGRDPDRDGVGGRARALRPRGARRGGIAARVVSMPCWELFDRQPRQYRDEVLPPAVRARVAIEQASTLGWDRYVGDGGAIVGMHTFGASAPLKMLVEKFGFTPDTSRPPGTRLRAGRRRGGPRGRGGNRERRPQSLHELGQSLWLDNITRGCSTRARSSATSTSIR